VLALPALAHPLGGAVEIAGHDVPADPALGEMIERRHAARERKRRLIGERDGDAEAEMLGRRRHGRNQQERIIHRRLCRMAQRRFRSAGENVVHTQHVGQKKTIEQAALQRARKLDPRRR
jgi:hypothetical protein